MPRIRSALVAVALLHGAAFLPAQRAERATFYLIVGNDTATIERVTRVNGAVEFSLFDRKSRARVEFLASLSSDGLVSEAKQEIFAASTDSAPAMRFQFRFKGDSVGIQRGDSPNWIRVGLGVLPTMNVSATLIEQSLLRARALGVDSVVIPLIIVPSGPSLPVTIVRRDSLATLRLGGVVMEATLLPDGRLAGAVIPSQNARFARGPATAGPFPGIKTFAPPPGAPYSAQDVTIRTPAGLTLRGTLTLPQTASGARVPAIVTITGSGPQDRDATPTGIPAYRSYYQLADTLGRRGIAVLRLDDRGAGSDGGPMTVTSADFADDIRVAVSWLRARPEIDPRRVGLVGHSEGGLIAPMVAVSDSAIAAVVILAGTASPGREIVAWQQRYMVDSVARIAGQQRAAALAQFGRNTDSVAAAMPWMRFFLEYDVRPTAARMRAPVLILHGEKDYQVPAAEAEKLAAAVRSGGNRDVTVRVFPGLNHLFLPYGGAGFSYENLTSFVVSPVVMGTIADWLATRLTR